MDFDDRAYRIVNVVSNTVLDLSRTDHVSGMFTSQSECHRWLMLAVEPTSHWMAHQRR